MVKLAQIWYGPCSKFKLLYNQYNIIIDIIDR